MKFNLHTSFTDTLPADALQENYPRRVKNTCFSYVQPTKPKNPSIIAVNKEVARLLKISDTDYKSKAFLEIVTGASPLPGAKPYAMCYGGHQFGQWAGQLGDGRAITIGHIQTSAHTHYALQLKGAGKTPYSRTADGNAVLRSSIREYLCSEAMHHLGVPTTRALSLCLSGDMVLRDVLYNGNAAYEPGAIVCRVASNFIRFGNFEILAARKEYDLLEKLTDYTIAHFYPEISDFKDKKQRYLAFFKAVCKRTLDTFVHWQRIGFVHGVLNTDNMSITGLTIDYGPYGWLEDYNPNWTPNTTDNTNKRYRFGNQANIALYNLIQLANALYPLIEDATALETILEEFTKEYDTAYTTMMLEKLGLKNTDTTTDTHFIGTLEHVLAQQEIDFTIFFRNMAKIKMQDMANATKNPLFTAALYDADKQKQAHTKAWDVWFLNYQNLLKDQNSTDATRRNTCDRVNPKYVLRNYMAQLAITAAEKQDYHLIHELETLLKHPYNEQPEYEKWFAKRPDWAKDKVGCSQLSCSS